MTKFKLTISQVILSPILRWLHLYLFLRRSFWNHFGDSLITTFYLADHSSVFFILLLLPSASLWSGRGHSGRIPGRMDGWRLWRSRNRFLLCIRLWGLFWPVCPRRSGKSGLPRVRLVWGHLEVFPWIRRELQIHDFTSIRNAWKTRWQVFRMVFFLFFFRKEIQSLL